MAKKNNYKNPQAVVDTVETEEVATVDAAQIMEDEVPVEDSKPVIYGTVTNCVKLNVRKKATVNSDVIAQLVLNDKVEIDEAKSTKEFYKVTTAAGVVGYCMKQFINK